jgi:N-acetylmuramoyl-L-alanine amidase
MMAGPTNESSAKSSRQSSFRVTLVFALALALFVSFVVLSSYTSSITAARDETTPPGPICFFQNGVPFCVERTNSEDQIASDDVEPVDLLVALLDGPTSEERLLGIETALPPGTELVSLQSDATSVTVRLAFPEGFLESRPMPAAEGLQTSRATLDFMTAEAIVDQIYRTLMPLEYQNYHVEAQDPADPERFRPLSGYLPPVTVPAKPAADTSSFENSQGETVPVEVDADATAGTTSQPPIAAQARPQGALTGKTVYVSAGHGWQWTGSAWRTQRPPYPDASTGYYGPIIEDHNNAEVVNQYLLRYLWNAGADVWTARERDMNPHEDIVDNNESGFSTSGAWGTVDGSGYLNRYLQAATDSGGSATATWTSDPVPSNGTYSLYVWYASGSDRTSDARYTVQHAGGSTVLTVDQTHHGHTWRYVGRFPVSGGQRLVVTLSSQSATSGRIVVADAIRVGGGWFDDGDLASNGGPVETTAPTGANEPWWEVASYYHVQRLGADPDNFSYFNDVVARPMWARWEHANTGDDAVFISWHTNGYNGHNTTAWGTVSYIHDYKAVAGSAALRHAIHSELINDFRAGWDPAWRDIGEYSKDLGELRELWDSNPSNAIPGVLLEIAYHDHVENTDALKDPRFALISARAVYQGIVKYYGSGLPLLPEPPTHLVVRNHGPGQVKVSWRPSPVDGSDLVGDAAESYRVYTSPDGFGWDNGRVVHGTETILTGLQEDALIFVRVTGVNAGGESFPTPVLAARSSGDGAARTLLVNAFDRIDRHGTILEDDPIYGYNARLFPDQINSFDYVIQHAENIPYPFDSAVNEAVADGDLGLGSYGVLDWISGEESTGFDTFNAAEQAAVRTYLDDGGALFVSGAEIGWDLVSRANGIDFYHDYLRADMVGDDAGTYQVDPTSGGIFAGLGSFSFNERYDVDFPDQLAPRGGSVAALNYVGGSGGVAALQYDGGGCRRLVYMGFPFETIAASKRAAVMSRVFEFMGAAGCVATPPETTITLPLSGTAYNTMPEFQGGADGYNPIDRVEVQIVDPNGRYWDGQNWDTTPRWILAIGTNPWQYPLTSLLSAGGTNLAQGAYHLLARAWDTTELSDTTPADSVFVYDTIPPDTPGLIAPTDGITVSPLPSGYYWSSPLNDTGSALSYHLQIDNHVLTQVTTYFGGRVYLPNGMHSWRVRAFDAAGNYSSWTAPWSFFVEHLDWFFPVFLQKSTVTGTATAKDTHLSVWDDAGAESSTR